jgi:hypothetical protein
MAEAVYLLCALTSVWCAVALLRTYLRRRSRVLLWSCLYFAALSCNNALLFVDLVVLPTIDLSLWRAIIGTSGTLVLAVGLVWDVE